MKCSSDSKLSFWSMSSVRNLYSFRVIERFQPIGTFESCATGVNEATVNLGASDDIVGGLFRGEA